MEAPELHHRHVSHLYGLYPERADRPGYNARARRRGAALARDPRRRRHRLGHRLAAQSLGAAAGRRPRPRRADPDALARPHLSQHVRRAPAVPDRRQLRRRGRHRRDAPLRIVVAPSMPVMAIAPRSTAVRVAALRVKVDVEQDHRQHPRQRDPRGGWRAARQRPPAAGTARPKTAITSGSLGAEHLGDDGIGLALPAASRKAAQQDQKAVADRKAADQRCGER